MTPEEELLLRASPSSQVLATSDPSQASLFNSGNAGPAGVQSGVFASSQPERAPGIGGRIQEAKQFLQNMRPENSQALMVAGLSLLRGDDVGTAGLNAMSSRNALVEQARENEYRKEILEVQKANAGKRSTSEFERLTLAMQNPNLPTSMRELYQERLDKLTNSSPSTQIVMPEQRGQRETQKKLGQNLVKMIEMGESAASRYAVADLAGQFSDEAYEGTLAPIQLEAVRLGKSLGISQEVLDKVGGDAAATSEFFQSLANQLVLDTRSGQRDPQMNAQENQIIQQSGPQLSQTAAGRKMIIELVKFKADKERRMGEYVSSLIDQDDPRTGKPYSNGTIRKLAFEWDRDNPTFPPEMVEKVRAMAVSSADSNPTRNTWQEVPHPYKEGATIRVRRVPK